MKLRQYQAVLVERVKQAFQRRRRVLMVLPTGGGKTVVFTAIAESLADHGLRTNVLVHRRELLRQVQAAVGHVAGVGMIQSAGKLPPAQFLVIDEAHHAVSPSYRRVIDDFDVPVLGVTATPLRRDGVGLGEVFEEMVVGPSAGELVSEGYLTPVTVYAPLSLKSQFKPKRSIADYSMKELANLNRPDVYDFLPKFYDGKSGLTFCVSVEAARIAAGAYNRAGIPAISLTGDLSDRERELGLTMFREGRVKILTSCDLISEGFDVPAVHSVYLCRPTTSLALHLQQIGRALRPCVGKERAVVYDFVGNTLLFGTPLDEFEWTLEGQIKPPVESRYNQCPVCWITWRKGTDKPCQCVLPTTDKKPVTIGKMTDEEFEVHLTEIPDSVKSLLQQPLSVAKTMFQNAREIDIYCRFKNYKRGAAYHLKVELGFLPNYTRWKKSYSTI